jgi:hypothetical protein
MIAAFGARHHRVAGRVRRCPETGRDLRGIRGPSGALAAIADEHPKARKPSHLISMREAGIGRVIVAVFIKPSGTSADAAGLYENWLSVEGRDGTIGLPLFAVLSFLRQEEGGPIGSLRLVPASTAEWTVGDAAAPRLHEFDPGGCANGCAAAGAPGCAQQPRAAACVAPTRSRRRGHGIDLHGAERFCIRSAASTRPR